MIRAAVQPVGSDSLINSIGCRYFFDTYDIMNSAWIRYPIDLMYSQPKVLFYGNSLVLAGVQATFKGDPGFETIALDQPTTQTELRVLNPSVVVFDMRALESDFLLSQMQELPGLLLVGVDPESHEVLLTGQAACSISLEQITQIVRDLVGDPIPPSAKGSSSARP